MADPNVVHQGMQQARFDGGANAQAPDEYADQERMGAGVELPGRQALDQVVQNAMLMNNGKQSVPAYNQAAQKGYQGVYNADQLGQGTILPQQRRFDQAANYNAIMGSLPPAMQMANQQIIKTIQTAAPEVYRRMGRPSSIYEQYPRDFMVNRINLSLQNRRLNSIYGIL